MEFKQLGISAPILKVLAEQAYEVPTPIQEKTIPGALNGNDVLGLAQTGTGKTAAFSVPTLQRLAKQRSNPAVRTIRALVLTPTRELALQVYESFNIYGRYLPLKSAVVFGGVGQEKQVNDLKRGIDILVATPGRLMDLMNQGHIDISQIEIFILDEADRMLDMGFIHDVRRIIKYLPVKKQTLLFSATMPKEMGQIVDQLLVNPIEVSVTPVSSTVDTIQQYVCFVDRNHKIDVLTDFLKENDKDPVLIFTRTKHGSDKVVKQLGKRNIKAQAIHGGKSQNARQTALQRFKDAEIAAMAATDIASRGIDINELKYVVNYDLPEVPETYVHRIGRTGRAGNTGVAVSFCSFPEMELLKSIEKLINKKIEVLDNHKYPMVDMTIPEKSQGKKPAAKQPAAKQPVVKQSAAKEPEVKAKQSEATSGGKTTGDKRTKTANKKNYFRKRKAQNN